MYFSSGCWLLGSGFLIPYSFSFTHWAEAEGKGQGAKSSDPIAIGFNVPSSEFRAIVHWLLASGFWLPYFLFLISFHSRIGHWSLVIGFWLLTYLFLIPFFDFLLFNIQTTPGFVRMICRNKMFCFRPSTVLPMLGPNRSAKRKALLFNMIAFQNNKLERRGN